MSFIGIMKDKIERDRREMSFIGVMKYKIEQGQVENDFQWGYEGQNRAG